MADCGCGRSPTGKCMGWHALTEGQYQEKKAAYEAKKSRKITIKIYPHRLCFARWGLLI